MATPVFIPVEQYLRTVFRPDCDYIEGEVQERNMGETLHGRLQAFFAFFFRLNQDKWSIDVLTEQRLRVADGRYRVADLILSSIPNRSARFLQSPPLLCVEILASEDRMRKVQERLNDYADMGVQSMWVIDPWRETAYFAGPDGIMLEQKEALIVPETSIRIAVPEIFAELDRLEKRATGR